MDIEWPSNCHKIHKTNFNKNYNLRKLLNKLLTKIFRNKINDYFKNRCYKNENTVKEKIITIKRKVRLNYY